MGPKNYQLQFVGKGFELFKIQIVNLILSLLTLGLYFPWARAKTLQYVYSQTLFEEQPFVFTGIGKQMFKGFIKAMLFFVIAFAAVIVLKYFEYEALGLLIFYAIILAIIPLALHGTYRYRMAKTLWSGIRFGYDDSRKELAKLFYLNVFFTICTFGVYGAWLTVNLRRYIIDHIKFGDARFFIEVKALNIFG
jgi:uncharacterized membrane protein YjgN (DUF898 family)